MLLEIADWIWYMGITICIILKMKYVNFNIQNTFICVYSMTFSYIMYILNFRLQQGSNCKQQQSNSIFEIKRIKIIGSIKSEKKKKIDR